MSGISPEKKKNLGVEVYILVTQSNILKTKIVFDHSNLSDKEYCEEAWNCAVEDGDVDQNDRDQYDIQVRW
jgi:hypothetical protein